MKGWIKPNRGSMSTEILNHDSHLDDPDRRHQELMAVITDILIPDEPRDEGSLDESADEHLWREEWETE